MFRSLLIRLFLMLLIFIGGLLFGIELVNKMDPSPPSTLTGERFAGTTRPEENSFADSSSLESTAAAEEGESESAAETRSQADHADGVGESDENAAGLQKFRPEPGLHIRESLMNKVLRKTGEAVHLLAEGIVKVIAALLDGISG